jgi:RNA polymerase sigma-70 factor (ECF subfamily)
LFSGLTLGGVEIMERTTGLPKHSDATLIAAIKRGDAEAFEKLALRYKARVLAVAYRITKNREDAEDVVQQCFHKVYLHLDDFQERSLFSTWLIRIAVNESLMVLRRTRKILEVFPKSSDHVENSISKIFVDRAPNPEESYLRRERIEILKEAITRLGPIIRRTILARYMDERSVEETAHTLRASIAAVKSRLSRGREELSGEVDLALVQRS